MRTVIIALLILFFLPPAFAQQSTWWIVLVTDTAISGRNISMLVGPYPSFTMCNEHLPEARRSVAGAEVPLLSSTCRSNIDIARMMLKP